MDIKDNLTSCKAKFIRYKQGVAYYAVPVPYSEMLYSFPVPVNSVDETILVAEKNTIYFMDHIQKAIYDGTFKKEAA